MSNIHHLLCTHCTFGSSALENDHSAEATGRVLGYSVRASSIEDRSALREEFRAVERLLSYDLPLDSSAEHRKRLTSLTAPVRLCFMPDVSGRQVVGQLAFRPFDTAGRPGSYFAHLLVSPTATATSWSVIDCLRLWGRKDDAGVKGWCNADREAGFKELTALPSLDAWHGRQRAEHWDELAKRFLKQGTAPSSWRKDIVIPDRWRSNTSEEDRVTLVKSVLQALLDKKSLPTVILAIEPEVAIIVFYAVLRLMPSMLRSGVGFSTYEPDPSRVSYRLVATTFVSDAGDLKPQLYQSESYVCNSFRGFLTGSSKPVPGKYAAWAVRMLSEGKLTRVDNLCSVIEKVWSSTPEDFSAADLERIRDLEDYWNKLLRGDFRTPPAGLSKPHRHFLAKRCSSAVRVQQSLLSQMPAADSAKLIRTLMDVIKPFPEEWRLLESTPDIATWIKGAMPTDEPGVLALLAKPASTFSNPDAVELLIRFVAEHGRLPGVKPHSARLWGTITSEQAPDAYVPPLLLVTLLAQLDSGSLKRILTPPHAGVDVVKSVATAIGSRLQATPDEGHDRTESRRLVAHLRCLLDNAAIDLNPKDFELLLRGSQEVAGFYNPEKGDFGDRVARFVSELRTRASQVCLDAEIIKLANTWAQCATDRSALQSQLTAWKKLLSWFALFDRRGETKIPFAGYWRPANQGVFGEIRGIVRDIVPDSDITANTIRRNLLTTILSTYRQNGLLPAPGKGLLGFGTKKDFLLETIEDLCKQPLR